jgi:hypothetical protein
MKQKILFYLLIFSILINIFLVVDYGKRLSYTQNKIVLQDHEIEKLKDSLRQIKLKVISQSK